ncbi:MAG TPA: phenylalanine--tRNA ligase subunit beta [Polyangiaceae bacterium]|nr:phenylalanine--tRNA ligase subunit beta [Polyangiaceae bacterium]
MKASYRWLRALVPQLSAPPPEVAERFTRAGLEIEGLHPYGNGLEPIVVAAVRKVEPHPSRSGLQLVTVDRGEGHEQRVVCGASNVPAVGGLVVLAPLGTHLPAKGVTIGAREIAGITSEGMLCSEAEMGLLPPGGGGDDGILVLPAGTAAPGTALLKAVPAASDTIFEIAVPANRSDPLGHVGLARELAALYGLPFTFPAPESPARVAEGKIETTATVTVEDFERCPHYGAAAVLDVKVGPSPDWLRYRLASLGVRPISNVVDVTNLVLFEFGHPIHAFDLDEVRGHAIVVRRARAGETLVTLDGVTRKLDTDDLLICDEERPVGLAGVMGGQGSEISERTHRVLIECAYFAPRGIRRTSRRYGLHTEASQRFERGVDRGDTPDVLAHAASLIVDLAAGAAVAGAIHKFQDPPPERKVRLRAARLDALLGAPVPFAEATAILKRLGFGAEPSAEPGSASFSVPTHRPDVEREVDLIEEVARVRGLDAIPSTLPAIRPQAPRDPGVLDVARRAAVALGLAEAITFGFVSPKDLDALGAPPSPIKLENPLGEERSVMRTSMMPGLLDAVRRAWRAGETEIRLFSIGNTFSEGSDARGLPRELPTFAAVLAGSRRGYLSKPDKFDVYDAKGVAIEVVERVSGRGATVRSQTGDRRARHLHPRGAADVLVDGQRIGQFGPLHPDVLKAWDLELSGGVVVEIDLTELGRVRKTGVRYAPVPRLPAATRDIALVVREEVPAGEVERVIREAAGDLCESVQIFDVFRGPSLPGGHRSLAFHVVYRDPKAALAHGEARTLTDREVDERHAAVVAKANAELGATLRA